ncbi:hypothetical protein BDD12DRAFT_192691 [Trichophaea hybrida]|nr:hypothetical protein BDD12DRAFT_192691 [Trichophaea hybrida]
MFHPSIKGQLYILSSSSLPPSYPSPPVTKRHLLNPLSPTSAAKCPWTTIPGVCVACAKNSMPACPSPTPDLHLPPPVPAHFPIHAATHRKKQGNLHPKRLAQLDSPEELAARALRERGRTLSSSWTAPPGLGERMRGLSHVGRGGISGGGIQGLFWERSRWFLTPVIRTDILGLLRDPRMVLRRGGRSYFAMMGRECSFLFRISCLLRMLLPVLWRRWRRWIREERRWSRLFL